MGALIEWRPELVNQIFKVVPDPLFSHPWFGQLRQWDVTLEQATMDPSTNTLTMACWGFHGRWGNMVLQYLYASVLSYQNKWKLELPWHAERAFYQDLQCIPHLTTYSATKIIDSYRMLRFNNETDWNSWCNLGRMIYLTSKKGHKRVFVIQDYEKALLKPLSESGITSAADLEGLFFIPTSCYRTHHKAYIKNLLAPATPLKESVQSCMQQLYALGNVIIGIHIRRGDYIENALDQSITVGAPMFHYFCWLKENLHQFSHPVIFISSEDKSVVSMFQKAGFNTTVSSQQFFLPESQMKILHLIDWEILRNCDVILSNNSTFSFTACLLSNNNTAICFRPCFSTDKLVSFDPWNSQPIQLFPPVQSFWLFVPKRFLAVYKFAGFRAALIRLKKDVRMFFSLSWRKHKLRTFYYHYGLLQACFQAINPFFWCASFYEKIFSLDDFLAKQAPIS